MFFAATVGQQPVCLRYKYGLSAGPKAKLATRLTTGLQPVNKTLTGTGHGILSCATDRLHPPGCNPGDETKKV